jgi:hypothetical protein
MLIHNIQGDGFAAVENAIIQNAVSQLALIKGQRGDAGVVEHIRGINAERFDAAMKIAQVRPDALGNLAGGKVRQDAGESNGFFQARQLEYRYAEAFQKPLPPLSAFTGFTGGQPLFPITREVALGAKTHTVTREDPIGEAQVIRGGGSAAPQVALQQVEESFPVLYYGAGFNLSIFDMASSNFANASLPVKLASRARDAIMRLMNKATWFGIPELKMRGVLNYDWLPKKVVSTAFSLSASADDMLAELQALANFPAENSKNVLFADTMLVSTKIYYIISQKRLGSTASGTIETVLEFFKRTHPTIKDVILVPELDAAGPGGEDGVLCYNRSFEGISNVVVADPTAIPVQRHGYDDLNLMFGAHGGIVMRHAGANILGWVSVS